MPLDSSRCTMLGIGALPRPHALRRVAAASSGPRSLRSGRSACGRLKRSSTHWLTLKAIAPAAKALPSVDPSRDFSGTNNQVNGVDEADLLKTDHRIELAEGLSADCRQLLQNLADADKADEDAAARQSEYVAAQAALDSAEEEYSTMQRQVNANPAGLLAKDLKNGTPCPVCGATERST